MHSLIPYSYLVGADAILCVVVVHQIGDSPLNFVLHKLIYDTLKRVDSFMGDSTMLAQHIADVKGIQYMKWKILISMY